MIKEENLKEENEAILNFLSSLANDLSNPNGDSICKCEVCGKYCLDLTTLVSNINDLKKLKNSSIEGLCKYTKQVLEDNKFVLYGNKLYCYSCYDQYKVLNSMSKKTLRPSKINYYLNIAKEVSTRSTCLRKKYGAIIVKNDSIISTGYNGSPRCTINCIDLGECRREKLNIPRGERYELCRAVHAEQNCIINASKEQMLNSDLYLYGSDYEGNIINNMDSCQMCKKLIINSGINRVICAKPNDEYIIYKVEDWIKNDETLTNKLGY